MKLTVSAVHLILHNGHVDIVNYLLAAQWIDW